MGWRRVRLSDRTLSAPGVQPLAAPARLPLVMPHIERGPHPDVLAAVLAAGYEPRLELTEKADPYSYSSLIRRLWREGTGWLMVEMDALPPAGGLAEMEACPELVCNRPHNCRRQGVMGSLACVKFSRELVQADPDFADRVLARRRPVEWWKAGFLLHRPYFHGAARPGGLSTACVDPEKVAHLGPWPGPLWPTTQEWPHSDTVIFAALDRAGIATHYHEAPSVCFKDPDEQLRQ